MTIALAARLAAWAIAIAAAIDPTVVASRPARPIVAIVVDDGAHMRLPTGGGDTRTRRASALDVAATLEQRLGQFADVTRGVAADARAWIVVGADAAPRLLPSPGVPVWTIDVADTLTPNVAVTAATADVGHLSARAQVHVSLSGIGVAGRTSTVALTAASITLAEARHRWSPDETSATVTLEVVPWRAPLLELEVHVATDVGEATTIDNARALTMTVDDRPWRVFVHEPRPSWNVTFARRALEADRRFSVETRTTVSRGIVASTAAPARAAAALSADVLAPFDAILVGAPDRLTPAEWRVLDAFATIRGGAVLLVLDRVDALHVPGLGAVRFQEHLLDSPVPIPLTGVGESAWSASELAVLAATPAGVDVLSRVTLPGSGTRLPTVIRRRRGDGQVIVFGALDAWRQRGSAAASFDGAWRALVGMAAAESLPVIHAALDSSIARPGATVPLRVRLRRSIWREADGSALPAVQAWLERDGEHRAVAVLPGLEPGTVVASVAAPEAPGLWSVVVSSPGIRDARATIPLLVANAAPGLEAGLPLAMLGRGRGGGHTTATDLDPVIAHVRASVTQPATPAPHTRFPMRSPWWAVAFVGLLGFEWWERRRRGER